MYFEDCFKYELMEVEVKDLSFELIVTVKESGDYQRGQFLAEPERCYDDEYDVKNRTVSYKVRKVYDYDGNDINRNEVAEEYYKELDKLVDEFVENEGHKKVGYWRQVA